MSVYKRLPLKIIKGRGSWVWDESGKKYLDAVAGIATCTLGHSDKKLLKVLTKQLTKIQHISNLYQIPEQEDLAEWLVDNSCADRVFFCNSGAEANEAAIKLARKYAHVKRNIQNPIILSAKSSFHGRTLAAVSATGQVKYHKNFEPLVEGFKFFSFNNQESVEKLFKKNEPEIAAILIEPIQGEGGLNLGDYKFISFLREYCSKQNILLIFDEVQSGMGRTGKLWGYENFNIEPDVFTIAKGLGGGHAIGALLVKEKANLFSPGDHASTFGGNPFACKAGLTVGTEIQKRNLLENVNFRGNELKEGLTKLSEDFPAHIEEVKGLGLMQGLAIKSNSKLTSQYFTKIALKEGLLVIGAGEKVIRMLPPLTISKREVKILISKLNLCLKKINS